MHWEVGAETSTVVIAVATSSFELAYRVAQINC